MNKHALFFKNHFLALHCRRRNDLMALLGDLPPEEAEKAIQNAFVVVKA